MASWMIHLRIADQLIDRIPDLDETAFVIGNIAPDSGVPNPDWTAYDPPKSVSHFKTKKEDETFFDIGRFISGYFTADKIRAYSRREFSFFLGYYVHLLADVDWTKDIYRPFAMDRPRFLAADTPWLGVWTACALGSAAAYRSRIAPVASVEPSSIRRNSISSLPFAARIESRHKARYSSVL